MLKFAPKSLAPKLLLVTGAIIAVLLIASNFVLISQTRDRVASLIGQQAETEAKAIAQGIVTDTSALASAARTMIVLTASLRFADRQALMLPSRRRIAELSSDVDGPVASSARTPAGLVSATQAAISLTAGLRPLAADHGRA